MFDRTMNADRAIEVLKEAEYGVLSTCSKDGNPYGVAINYVYVEEENCLYFHTKKVGTKMENIKQNPNVSLFVVENQEVIPERYITHYESVIVKGKASIILDEEEIREKLLLLCNRLAPNAIERREAVIDEYINTVCIGKISIESISGKKNNDY